MATFENRVRNKEDLVALDFEIYYNTAQGPSLECKTKKNGVFDPAPHRYLSPLRNTRFGLPVGLYVRHPDFEFQSLHLIYRGEDYLYWGHDDVLRGMQRWKGTMERSAVLAHNVNFDGALLYEFGITPKMYICSQALVNHTGIALLVRSGLAHVTRWFADRGADIPTKLDTLAKLDGMTVDQIEAAGLAEEAKKYVHVDAQASLWLFEVLAPTVPWAEFLWSHILHVTSIHRDSVRFDQDVINAELACQLKEMQQAAKYILRCLTAAGFEVERSLTGVRAWLDRTNAAAQKDLATLLRSIDPDIELPFKQNKKGETVLAFAKSDAAFTALQERASPPVKRFFKSRSVLKDNTQNRNARFAMYAEMGGVVIPYKPGNAHTGRPGGADRINVANLPTGRGGKRAALRESIRPLRDDHAIVAYDFSQMEPRITAFVSNEEEDLQVINDGLCIYCAAVARYIMTDMTVREVNDLYVQAKQNTEAGQTLATQMREVLQARNAAKPRVLGLDYGIGARKYREDYYNATGVLLTMEQAERDVRQWRERRRGVANFQSSLLYALTLAADLGTETRLGGPTGDLLRVYRDFAPCQTRVPIVRVESPTGFKLNYPGFHRGRGRFGNGAYFYKSRKLTGEGERPEPRDKEIYAGSAQENISQWLSAVAAKELVLNTARNTMRKCGFTPRLVMHTYDENVYVIPKSKVDDFVDVVTSTVADGLPWLGVRLDIDLKIGNNYAEAH